MSEAEDYDLVMKNICPKCRSELIHTRGCAICKKCGFYICEDLAEPPDRKEKHL